MRLRKKNEIRVYSKVNHAHLCAVAFKAKDILNFVRHYFFLLNNFQNEVHCVETILQSVVKLTKWDSKAVSNAITRLVNEGEFVRVKNNAHKLMINPEVANKYRMFFACKYEGKKLSYNDAQEALIKELKDIISKRDFMTEEEFLQFEEAEKEEADMIALKKIETLEETVTEQVEVIRQQNEKIENQTNKIEIQCIKLDQLQDLILQLINRVEVPTEIKAEVKRHLELVRD